MAVIFGASDQPSNSLPDFHLLDDVIKKGGHVLGYGLLAASYFHGLGGIERLESRPMKSFLAWALALIYAFTDEYHQSFISGRFPSLWDVFIFDNLGALAGVFLYPRLTRKSRNS